MEKPIGLVAGWSRDTLEKQYHAALSSAEQYAEAYGQMFKLSGIYEAALKNIKQTAERTDIPAGDALYQVGVWAEEALKHSLPREET